MLRRNLITGDYYHVYNRSARELVLFHDQTEFARFLFGLIYFQSPLPFPKVTRLAKSYSPADGFSVSNDTFQKVLEGRGVELVAFCIMSNHYHLIVRELVTGGIAKYMHRVNESYAKYHIMKYGGSGHIFSGRYQAKHIPENEYLTHVSAYIHNNPRSSTKWRHAVEKYPWSSLQDYIGVSRWGGLLAPEIVLDQFDGTTTSNYRDFVLSYTSDDEKSPS